MAQLRTFRTDRGGGVFLSLQMLKRHHRLIIERDGHSYLGFVRLRSRVPGDLDIVIPDPMWPEAMPGESTRLSPDEAARYEMRLAEGEAEIWNHVKPLLDMLVP